MYLSTHWSGFLGLERLFKLRAAIEAQYQMLNTNSRRNRLLFVLASRWQATAYTPDPHESWSKYPDQGNYPPGVWREIAHAAAGLRHLPLRQTERLPA